jgi:uncharacterized repeat protein (TIGR01451 family)
MTTIKTLRDAFASLVPNFLRPESARGQAGQGHREGGKGNALQCVTRSRLTENAGMRRATLVLSVAAGLVFAAVGASPAAAASPQWTVTSVSRPTNFQPGDQTGEDSYKVTLTNTGGASTDGSPVVVTDELPTGLSPDSGGASGENPLGPRSVPATPKGANFSCALHGCTYIGTVIPDQTLSLTFPVDVAPGPFASTCQVPATAEACLTNIIRVSGGGAPVASVQTPTVISTEPADFGISPGAASTALSSLQAGAHADITTSIAFNTVNSIGATAGDVKDTIDDLPPGFAGDLVDTPSCPTTKLLFEECPIPTQVGVTILVLDMNGGHSDTFVEPVYNVSPPSGEASRLGFIVAGVIFVQGGVSLRPRDYGLRASFQNVDEVPTEFTSVSLTVWGVPADPIHDPLRWNGHFAGQDGAGFGAPSKTARAPFFTNPTACGSGPLQATFTTDSWQQPLQPINAPMPFGPIVGCDRLTIEPTLEAQPSSRSAESATGLDVDLQVPQTYDNPDGLATSHLRDVKVTLPEGMSLNPSAGSGLGDCTEEQFNYEGGTFAPDPALGCPNESKIGTVHVKSPSLAEEATGSLFVAKPFDNPFHSLLALYLVARIPNRGVVVTAAGEVHADPVTGQLTTTFDENPQLPFSDFTLAFRQGATSPLVTPPVCGQFITNALLTPWSVPSQEHFLTSPFDITSGVGGGTCPSGGTPPFHPGLLAGTQNNAAGSYSPFYVRLSRQDGEQEITRFSIKLPPGVIGKLAGVPYCSDAGIAQAKAREQERDGALEEANPSCPAASEVGHSLVEAGVGSVLAHAPGKMYLAGPYHGSQLSLVSITAAKVGPFDLGTVVVRFALKIDPETAEVSVDGVGSDPIPHIVDGIPVHLRDIRAYVDRPNFTLNPTSCAKKSTASTVLGSGLNFVSPSDDVPVTVSSPFQAADCASLGFKPKLALSLKGGTKRGKTPAFKAVLTYPKKGAYANIRESQVTLPHSEFLEQGHIGTVCTRVQFKEGTVPGEKCPAASVYGFAKATTPILDEPIEGPVYLRSSSHQLPDLVAALHNKQVDIALAGHIDSVKGRIRNTFEAVPDAPVTKFTLEMKGGKKGLLVNSTNICKSTNRAISNFTGQNGKIYDTTPVLRASCGGKGKKSKAHKSKHHNHRAGR